MNETERKTMTTKQPIRLIIQDLSIVKDKYPTIISYYGILGVFTCDVKDRKELFYTLKYEPLIFSYKIFDYNQYKNVEKKETFYLQAKFFLSDLSFLRRFIINDLTCKLHNNDK